MGSVDNTTYHSHSGFALACMLGISMSVAAEEVQTLPELTVTGQPGGGVLERVRVDPDKIPAPTPSPASLMKRVPGGNVNANGALSGQTQLRGMFGPRMNVRVDGAYIPTGGPNWMDPPLHYVPLPLLDSLEVIRGIAPVSTGMGIGGYVDARTKSSRFTDTRRFQLQTDAEGIVQSVDDSYSVGVVVGLANRHHRFHVVGAREHGDDYDFGSGVVKASRFEQDTWGLGYGFRHGGHAVGVDFRRTDTDPTGNPDLPLDIHFFHTSRINVAYTGAWGGTDLRVHIAHTDVNHRMDNFTLRDPQDVSALPLPPFQGTERRFVDADSRGLDLALSGTHALAGGALTVGLDGRREDHNADVFDPDFSPFFVTNFDDARWDTYGVFVQWSADLGGHWGVELGGRYDRVHTDADRVDAFPAQLADKGNALQIPVDIQGLRDDFNASDRSQTDNNLDWVAKLSYTLNEAWDIQLGVARKTRSPSYIERYLWIPLEVNSGLGDGNNYVGSIGLDPEVSHQVELGVDGHAAGVYWRPRVYYRRVDDYIQGVPAQDPRVIRVSGMANGDPNPLIFDNVDAKIYGADMDFGYTLHPNWHVDGVATYVRGRRRDISDNLYRITPPNLRVGLTHERARWAVTAEGVWVFRQGHISKTITRNSAVGTDAQTPSYRLLNLFGRYRLGHLSVLAGIDNVLDNGYIDHLAGFNRVVDSDVAVGQRLPGRGRNLYLRARYIW